MNLWKRAALALLLWALPLGVQAATPDSKLSAQDTAEVARVEQYLNSIRSVVARFMQVASDGSAVQGNFYLQRPGKMRIQYDKPYPLLMVASGIYLTVYDPELKQTSYLPIDSTPAYFLVKEKISPDDVTVTKVERGMDSLRVTLHEAGHPDQGRLTLVFSDNPLQLKKWTVIDRDGKQIEVALLDALFNTNVDPDVFKFVDPSPSKGAGRLN